MKKYKIYITLILMFIALNSIYANNLQISGEYNTGIINHPMNLTNSIILRKIPNEMYKQNKSFQISWTPINFENAKLYYSTSPNGAINILNNYIQAPENIQSSITLINGIEVRTINTNALSLNISAGNYYCVIHDETTQNTSMEFELIIIPDTGVQTISPFSGSIVNNNQTPLFSWQAQAGVPYYHIILSDQPFTLSYDDDDKLVVDGLNVIWQIVTSSTSAQYGIPDPSGSITNPSPPPLINNKEYNWVVLANFGNDPLYSSDVTGNPSGFTYQSANILPSANLTSPINNEDISDETILFIWDDIPQAVNYHIYLSEKRLEAGSVVFYPIWDQITTNNMIEFNASDVLISSEYVWHIIAFDDNNNNSSSSTFTFNYEIPIGTLNISVYDTNNNEIGYASVNAIPIEGSMDNVPFTVNAQGKEKKKLPLGQYTININKTGYETASYTVNITEDPNYQNEDISTYHTFLTAELDYSPAFFTGSVKNNEQNITNVTVKATKSTGEIRTQTSSTGNYSIAVTPGTWTLSAEKQGYSLVSTINSSILSGQSINITNPSLEMSLNTKNINGAVQLPNGTVLPQVTVKLQNGNTSITKITDNTGSYQFTGVSLGTWILSWQKTGYTPPPSQTLNILSTTPSNTTISTAIMTPRANIISGSSTNGNVGISNVQITAIPLSGSAYQTTTDIYGQYSLNLPQGNYTITASHPQYSAQNNQQVNLTVGQTINNLNISLIANQSFITGTVLSNNTSLSNVTITAGNFSTQTNPNGYYSLPVSSGTYNIIASKSGYITANQNNISVGIAQTINNINFSLNTNPAQISGFVLLNGSGVANATISGYRLSGNTQIAINPVNTNNIGQYTLSLSNGNYFLTANKTGLISNTINVNVTSGSVITNQNITTQLNQALITGTIYNDQDNIIRNTSIIIQEINNSSNSYTTVSDIYGNYQINVTAGKTYKITASKSGYSSNIFSMNSPITIGSTLNQNFTLIGQNSSISGKITDQYNTPIPSAIIKAQNENETISVNSGATGNYSLSLAYGTWQLNITKPGYSPKDTIIVLNAGEQIANKDFIINTNFASLSGLVTDTDSQAPLSNITITASNSLGGGGTTTTNQNGQYTLSNLIPGNYNLSYSKNNYITKTINNVILSGNSNTTKNTSLTKLTGSLNITCNQNNVTLSIENTLTGTINNYNINAGQNQLLGLITNVPLDIHANKSGFIDYDVSEPITLNPDQIYNLTINLTEATGQISGFVQNEYEDRLAEVQVQITSNDGYSRIINTSSNGNYIFNNIPTNRTYTISASLTGYYYAPEEIILNNESLIINIEMEILNLSISGTVKNQLNNNLANIPIKAVSGASIINTITDANGIFNLNGVQPYKTYSIETMANTPGYENISIAVSTETSNLNLSNNPLIMQVHISSITGSIIDSSSSTPIAGATVIAFNNSNQVTHTTTTQSTGSFSLNTLYNGLFRLTIIKPNYQTQIIQDINLDYNQAISQDINLIYSAPVEVSGTVKNSYNQDLLAYIPVKLITSQATLIDTTDSNGNFTFFNVNPFTNNVIVSTNLLPNNQFDNDTYTFNTTNQNIANINLNISYKNSNITGVVTNQNNQVLDLVRLTLIKLPNGPNIQFTTGTSGLYSFTNLYEGNYQLIATRGSYQTSTIDNISLSNGTTLNNDILLEQITGQIAGIIKDNFNNPLRNCELQLFNIQDNSLIAQVLSQNDGSFIFDTVNEGTYRLSASKTGYQPQNNLQVEHNASNTIITLTAQTNAIIGTIYYQNDPYSDEPVSIKALNSQNQLRQTLADEYGDYSITDITGSQRIWAETSTYTSYWEEINISAGQTLINNIHLITSNTVPGKVTYEENGVAGASIIATNINSGRVFNASTNNQGLFSLTGIPEADYLIQGYLEGYVFNETFPTIEVTNNQETDSLFFTVSFTGNSISGSAINSISGNGINNVTIELWGDSERFNKGKHVNQISSASKETTLLTTTQTNNSGAFSFTNIIDGTYILKASKIGYDDVENINISVINGLMSPSVAQFVMVPIVGVIYGIITDAELSPITQAQITITKQDNESITDIVYSNNQGYYSYIVPGNGNYIVKVEKEYYYPSNNQIVYINTDNDDFTSAEVNFQLFLQPATLSGSIQIIDLTDSTNPIYSNPDSLIISLLIPGENPIIEEFSDSTFIFNNINLHINQYEVQLNIRAVYNNTVFKSNPSITLTPGENTSYNINFTYKPGAKTISGQIRMKIDEDTYHNIANAHIYLMNYNTAIDSVTTNTNGFYQFNSVIESEYRIKIIANYDFETFEFLSEILTWPDSDENITLNYDFQYILSKLSITLLDEIGYPITGNNIIINSENLSQPIIQVTNNEGLIETESILHSGIYSINIVPQIINNQTWIYPEIFNIEFEKIESKSLTIKLPLKFNLSELSSVASSDSIKINIIKSITYGNEVILHYTNTFNQNNDLTMNQISNNLLETIIPAQNRSGIITFYFTSLDTTNNLFYSNQNNPIDLTITSEGIISQSNSYINPNTATLSYMINYQFEVNLADELENNLNELIDNNPEAIVEWTLQDTTIGYLEAIEGEKRQIKYYTPTTPSDIMNNIVKVRVRVGEYTITLQSDIIIRDLKLKQIDISDDDNEFKFKVDNNSLFKLFKITALSEENIIMTIPMNISEINSNQGNFIKVNNGVRYYPNNNFIGKTTLSASAYDPIYENQVIAKQDISVYKLIQGHNEIDTLQTDNNCSLIIPENMLRDGSAQLYLYKADVSPSQGVGIDSEVVGNIYNSEVSGSSNFMDMPTIVFETNEEDNLNIAWWDIYKLNWIPIENDLKTNQISAKMPGWYQYSLLRESLKLGLYDLKLLPNPFTPNDIIGSNQGLQISFKVSSNITRYPKVTCKVYNLQGTLVKTIADNEPILKGFYGIGDENSLYWNGYTNDNRLARNGRYIIHLIVEDSKDRKEFVKPVVLVK
jgi:protocatechuate 3,4-dioxygenase beta subunit